MNGYTERAGLVLGLALMSLTLACGASEVTQAESVDSLVARHLEARGGAERLEGIETLFMSGRATTGPGRVALVTREVRPPDRIRTEFSHQGVTSVFACSGSTCWFVDPMSGDFEAALMSETNAKLALDQADILGIIDFIAKGHRAELLGTETIDGKETYKLAITSAGGAEYVAYLDTESALMVREETTRTIGDQSVEVVTTFGDFKPVEGVVFPHSIRSSAVGRSEYLEVIVETIEINPSIDDARFEMPEVEPAG